MQDDLETDLRTRWERLAQDQAAATLGRRNAVTLMDREVRALGRRLARAGLTAAHVPVEHGGRGLPGRAVGVILECLAPHFGFTAFQVVARSVAAAGSLEARRTVLPRLLSGEWLGCAAISEPEVGSDAASVRCRAERRSDRYVLHGVKTWVLGGSAAHVANALVSTNPAAGSRGLTRLLVRLDQPGVRVEALPVAGATAVPLATITFDGAEAPLEYVLGEEGRGLALTLRGLEASRAAVASQAVGLARAALQVAIDRAGARQQFGRSIAGFQLVQSMIARMFTETEAAALMARQAWDAIDRGARSSIAASAAKFYCVEVALRVTQQAMELFGAAGLRDDLPPKRLHGYATGLAAPDGTLQVNQLILARELLGVSAFT